MEVPCCLEAAAEREIHLILFWAVAMEQKPEVKNNNNATLKNMVLACKNVTKHSVNRLIFDYKQQKYKLLWLIPKWLGIGFDFLIKF